MPSVDALRRRYWIAYPSWIVVSAIAVALLNGVSDDSARKSVASGVAERQALVFLRQLDPIRYAAYEPVSVAYSGKGESAGPARWVVLCDVPEHSGLQKAVVVEIEARTGRLIRVRTPGR